MDGDTFKDMLVITLVMCPNCVMGAIKGKVLLTMCSDSAQWKVSGYRKHRGFKATFIYLETFEISI